MLKYVIQTFRLGPFVNGQRVTAQELQDAGFDVDSMLARAAIGCEWVADPVEGRPDVNPDAAEPKIQVVPTFPGPDFDPSDAPPSLDASGQAVKLPEIKMGEPPTGLLPPLDTTPAPLPPLVMSINSDPAPPPAPAAVTDEPAPAGPTSEDAEHTTSATGLGPVPPLPPLDDPEEHE